MTPEQRIRAEVERVLGEHGASTDGNGLPICSSDDCYFIPPCPAQRLALMVKAALDGPAMTCRNHPDQAEEKTLEAMAAFLGEEGES